MFCTRQNRSKKSIVQFEHALLDFKGKFPATYDFDDPKIRQLHFHQRFCVLDIQIVDTVEFQSMTSLECFFIVFQGCKNEGQEMN